MVLVVSRCFVRIRVLRVCALDSFKQASLALAFLLEFDSAFPLFIIMIERLMLVPFVMIERMLLFTCHPNPNTSN